MEEENKALRQEATQLAKETIEVEEHEKKLISDMTSQLFTTNSQFDDIRKIIF